jgi:hypothetical protein
VSRRAKETRHFKEWASFNRAIFIAFLRSSPVSAFLSNPLLTRVPSGACRYHSFTPPPPLTGYRPGANLDAPQSTPRV